jgi:serine/threonine-protein kinase
MDSDLTAKEALDIVNGVTFKSNGKPLTDTEAIIFKGSWEKYTYEKMGEIYFFPVNSLREGGRKLWNKLSKDFGEKVSKTNFREAIKRRIDKKSKTDFYIERPPVEAKCYQELLNLGALIRITSPNKTGKSLLLNRILDYSERQGYESVILNFEEADSEILNDYKSLLQWFCTSLSDELELEDQLTDQWQDRLGKNKNTTNYLQKYLLANRSIPLVLVLEKVDLVFEQASYNNDFCKMLRSWYNTAQENRRSSPIWQNLRLIIVHSTEVYASLDIHSSPLSGAGLEVTLPDFTLEQVQTLAQHYQLTSLNDSDFEELMLMFGGYPYLIQTAFAFLKTKEFSLKQLLEIYPTEQSPFISQLREILGILQKCPELAQAYREVLSQNQPVRLSTNETFKLERLGLVRVKNNECKPRCDLYRQYFTRNL